MARLNYHHLYYFWRVATEGNLTQVANAIPVSQSALSSQIKQLEEYFATDLFRREGRRLEVTEAGQRVLAYANDIFATGEELESMRQRGLKADVQVLRIGLLTTLSRNFMDGLIAPLLENPRVRLTIQTDSLEGLLDGLIKHHLDVALTDDDVKGADGNIWQSQFIASQPVSIVGPPKGKPRGKFPKGYVGREWVVPNRDNHIRRAFEGFCARWQLEPIIKAESNDMAMLRLLARNSGTLAVLPTIVVRDELANGTLANYTDLPNVYGDFYAISIRRKHVPPALESLFSGYDFAKH